MVVLREAQAVRLGPHLSHLIYIYKSKITKYMYMVQCPIHRNRKVAILYIIKDPMKVISGLLPETWGYFCMNNFISTTRNYHSHFCPRLACGPPKLMDPGATSRLTSSLSRPGCE